MSKRPSELAKIYRYISPKYGEIPARKYVLLDRTYRGVMKYEDYLREMDRNRWTIRTARKFGVTTRRVAIDLYEEYVEGKIKVQPRGEYIGIEDATGYEIYYNPELKKYYVYRPVKYDLEREEEELVVFYIASIETGHREKGQRGHEPITVEIRGITVVKEKGAEEIEEITGRDEEMMGEIDTSVRALFTKEWGCYSRLGEKIMKKGIAFDGRTIIENILEYIREGKVEEALEIVKTQSPGRKWENIVDPEAMLRKLQLFDWPELFVLCERKGQYGRIKEIEKETETGKEIVRVPLKTLIYWVKTPLRVTVEWYTEYRTGKLTCRSTIIRGEYKFLGDP